jgi:uncharacterized RDD family membrane protein YckC
MFCMHCGARISDESRFCASCGKPVKEDVRPEEALPAPPTIIAQASSVPPPSEMPLPVDETGEIASLGKRFFAVILDSVLMMSFYVAIGMWIATKYGGLTTSGFSMEGKPALITMFVTSVIGFLYFWVMEGMFGATLGKKILGIKVTDMSGQVCGMKRSLIRNLLRIIDGLFIYLVGFIIALCSKKRQRLGDRIAETIVVEKGQGKSSKLVMLAVLFSIVVLCIIAAYSIHKTSGFVPGKSSIPPIGVTGGLELRDIYLSASQEGPALGAAETGFGQTVYTNAKLSGVQFRGENVNVKIGFQMTDSQGQVVIDEPNFLVINNNYDNRPGFFLSFFAKVTMPTTGTPGVYTQKFTVNDFNANKAVAYTFRVMVR